MAPHCPISLLYSLTKGGVIFLDCSPSSLLHTVSVFVVHWTSTLMHLSMQFVSERKPGGWQFQKCYFARYSTKFMIHYFHFVDLKIFSGNYASV